ncbi:spore coat protein CotJB [Alicyclobacillus fodiniaquatilis]|jgi:spore coat protein JB|uniref:Spore coat protein CotJB n=1 Tax=Alicyclobacillus fodiniaquatilis TaxID=1661150 RepID=A0ABW4JRG7_9BACL
MSEKLPKAYYQYLHELQSVDFVLVELTLYLDTHPDDATALAQFQQFQKRKENLVQQFESAFGPLYQYGGSPNNTNKWEWSEAPWPWQV